SRAVGVAKIMLPSWMARGLFLKIFTLGKELYPTIFCDAMKLLKNMGGGMDNVFLWWHLCNSVHPEEHYIQQLVIKILSITPHNAGCERIFSIIGWLIKGEHKISRWVNITDKELQELLQMEVNVVIDIPLLLPVDHDSQEFNMEEVLDK
ncbi:3415_t:CDS:2, partial [Rhizophagus irregularis]